jgi:hypothetical protein
MNLRGKGLHRSDPAKTSHRVGAELHPRIAAALAAGPKGSANLSQFLPPVFDQGGSSTCWAHSAASCLYGSRAVAGRPMGYVPSPLYFAKRLYASYREAATPVGQPLPALADTGAQLVDAAAIFGQCGEIPMGAPIDCRYSDVPNDTDGAFPELTPTEAQRGAEDTFGGEYSVAIDGDAALLVMATLDAEILLWDAFYADPACDNLGPNDILGAPVLKGGGGHSNSYWGYDLNATRKYPVDGPVFFKRGTWGSSYARGGDYLVSTGHVVNAWSLWPFAVAGAAS